MCDSIGALLTSSARHAEGTCTVTELSSSALTGYVARVKSGPLLSSRGHFRVT